MSFWVFACNITLIIVYFCKQADDYIGELIAVCHFRDLARSHCVKWQSPQLNRYHSTAAWGWGLEGGSNGQHYMRHSLLHRLKWLYVKFYFHVEKLFFMSDVWYIVLREQVVKVCVVPWVRM